MLAGGLQQTTILALFPELKHIDISYGGLSGTLPGLASLASIVSINLTGNQLTGNLPQALPLTLETLVLANNQFVGSLPPFINGMGGPLQAGSVKRLEFAGNQLTGALPEDWKLLQNLTYLDMHHNRIAGTLPAGVSRPTAFATETPVMRRIQCPQLAPVQVQVALAR